MIINSSDLTVLSVMQNDSGLGSLMVNSVKHFTKSQP